MKFKTAMFSELRGKLGHTLPQNTVCFRTYKNFGIQVIKNPVRKIPSAGSQRIYRHQMYYWSLHWIFLTDVQKAAYNELGEAAGITGYNYFMKEKQDPTHLYIHPLGYTHTSEHSPNSHYNPGESVPMGDYPEYVNNPYVKFPLDVLSPSLSITQATLHFFYYEESGWDADGKRVDCRSITENWDPRTLSWNNAPSVSAAVVDFVLMPGQMQWFEFDVTDAITDAIASPESWFGFRTEFTLPEPLHMSSSGMRSTLPHDNDYWPYLELTL